MMQLPVDERTRSNMPDERDRKPTDRPSSDAVRGEKAADPIRPTSTDKDESVPKTVETDLLIEDRFEATDN
jgi:hypothetical protein